MTRPKSGPPKSSTFVVDGPYSISTKKNGPWSKFCKRIECRSIDDLKKHGLIPAVIELESLKRVVDRVVTPAPAPERSKEHQIRDRDVDAVAGALGGKIALSVRRSIASKAVQVKRTGSYSVNAFQHDGDMEVKSNLIFDDDISVCTVHDLHVRPGAVVESRATNFLLNARSFSGTWRSAGTSGVKGADGEDGLKGTDGTPGRNAVCRDFLHTDLIPSDGTDGKPGGEGTDGVNGGAGSNGSDYTAHLEILVPGIVVDASGGAGGKGGNGGDGGAGGVGGRGGDGKGCEPSGMGGNGGKGGKGGNGAAGGKGGNAGDIYIYYVSDQSAGEPPVLTANAGEQGAGGSAGLHGEGGKAGAEGPLSKFGTKNWDPGPPGESGENGENGSPGNPGAPGDTGAAIAEKVPFI